MTNWQSNSYPFKKFTVEITKKWIECGFDKNKTTNWLDNGLQITDHQFAHWLENEKGINCEDFLENHDEDELRKEFNNSLIDYAPLKNIKKSTFQAQKWLDKNYPKAGFCLVKNEAVYEENNEVIIDNYNKKRSEIKFLDIAKRKLEGILDLSDFINLEDLICWGNQITQLILPNNDKLRMLDCSVNNLTKLDLKRFFNLKVLSCHENQLTQLNLPDSNNLTLLYCHKNQLNKLEITNNFSLKVLWCHENQLNHLVLPNYNKIKEIVAGNNFLTSLNYSSLNSKFLEKLYLQNNNFSPTNLSVFSSLINLTTLSIYGNKFYGSLKSLKNLTKLEELLNFENTNIDNGLEYLSKNLKEIRCNEKILNELVVYGYNLFLWQVYHPKLMKSSGKDLINLVDYNLEIKKSVYIPLEPKWLKILKEEVKNKVCYDSFNYSSSFWFYDIHPFGWKGNYFSKINKFLPTRLYQISTNQVIDSELIHNNSNYVIISYVWGDLANKSNLTTWNYTYQRADGTIENKQIGVNKEYGATGTTRESIQALKKAIAAIEFLNKEHHAQIDYLWMDQICINQFDHVEQGKEVSKMRQYYTNASATLVAIDEEVEKWALKYHLEDEYKLVACISGNIIYSSWFHRSWTFQEGILSKQTIFMLNNFLVDGRRLALNWGGAQRGIYNSNPRIFVTPLGWSYCNDYHSQINLNLGEALFLVSHRKQTLLVDKIYSILGLLPYGSRVKVDYKPWGYNYSQIELEEKLAELIEQAYQYDSKEIISYLGDRNPNNWLLPLFDENGLMQIKGIFNHDDQHFHFSQIKQITKQGILLIAHYTELEDRKIVEVDKYDKENNINLGASLQFILGKKNKSISVNFVDKTHYSEKKEPWELFIDMVNLEVILKSEYNRSTNNILVNWVEQVSPFL